MRRCYPAAVVLTTALLTSCTQSESDAHRVKAPATSTSESSPSASPSTASGLLNAAGHKVSYQCDGLLPSGDERPTVVLLTGLDNDMSVWDGTRRLLDDTPICTYDRANLGESASLDGPRRVADSVTELHGFLAAANLEPPYILVGHSYGGLLSMLYAAEHPRAVDALLLVDSLLPFEDELDEGANDPRDLRPFGWT